MSSIQHLCAMHFFQKWACYMAIEPVCMLYCVLSMILHCSWLAFFQLQSQQVHWQLFQVSLAQLCSTHYHCPAHYLFLIQMRQILVFLTISKPEILLRGLNSRFSLLLPVCMADAFSYALLSWLVVVCTVLL